MDLQHGHRATHVFDIGLHEADDPAIWEHARKENAVRLERGPAARVSVRLVPQGRESHSASLRQ
jgi:hypothetical protein